MKIREQWPKNYVAQRFPSRENITYFKNILKKAKDEDPIQKILASNPVLLRSLTINTRHFWCFDRPSFGGELIPDFLLCNHTSAGYQWTLVELESPCKAQLTKSGLPAMKLRQAIGQINDWRIWIRENIGYAQNHLKLKGLNAECNAFIIIGRRNMLDPKHYLKYRELSKNNLNVISYDRVVEMIQT